MSGTEASQEWRNHMTLGPANLPPNEGAKNTALGYVPGLFPSLEERGLAGEWYELLGVKAFRIVRAAE